MRFDELACSLWRNRSQLKPLRGDLNDTLRQFHEHCAFLYPPDPTLPSAAQKPGWFLLEDIRNFHINSITTIIQN